VLSLLSWLEGVRFLPTEYHLIHRRSVSACRLHVCDRLLEIHDGPFLELGLKGIAGAIDRQTKTASGSSRSGPAGDPVREFKKSRIGSDQVRGCPSRASSGRWMLAPPMLGDLVASADPDPVVALDVIAETGKRGGGRWLAGETAMQSDSHHLRRLLAFAVERIEIVAQRDEEILCLTPAQATREARAVVVERVRDDEMRPAVIVGPVIQCSSSERRRDLNPPDLGAAHTTSLSATPVRPACPSRVSS
jgi:hypothetical protein